MNGRLFAGFLGFGVASLFSGVEQEIGPVIVRTVDLVIAVAGIGVFVSMAMHKRFRLPSLEIPAMLFAVLVVYRAVNGGVLSSATEGLVELVQGVEFIIAIVLISSIMSRDYESKVFIWWFTCGVLLILIANTAYHLYIGRYAWYKGLNEPKLTYGIFGLLMIARYISSVRNSGRWGVATIFAVIMMVLSTERKGWVALLAAGLFILVMEQRNAWQSKFGIRTILAGVTILVVGLTSFVILQRSNDVVRSHFASMAEVPKLVDWESGTLNYNLGTTPSIIVRTYLLDFSIRSIEENPLFGIGSNEFKSRMAAVAGTEMRYTEGSFIGPNLKARISEGFGAHNEYAMYAVENGLIGLALYLSIWAVLFIRVVKLYRIDLTPGRLRYLRLLASMFVVYGAVVNLFLGGGATNTMFLALPIALVIGVEHQLRLFRRMAYRQRLRGPLPLQGRAVAHR